MNAALGVEAGDIDSKCITRYFKNDADGVEKMVNNVLCLERESSSK